MTDLALLMGGAVGGVLRMVLETVLPRPTQFPISTFLINLIGSFILAFFYELADRHKLHSLWKSGFGTGMIGAFTTFSTFSIETADLLRIDWSLALFYGLGSLILGLVFASAGERFAIWLGNRRVVRREGVQP